MDKSMKREQEHKKDRKKEPPTSTSTSPTISAQQHLDNVVTPNDDDSITTSTESSDTFETWTLVMDKQKNNDNVDRIEILKNSEGEDDDADDGHEEEEEDAEVADQQTMQDSLHDVTTDDLSDGISIISESESNSGRISPHPYLREHLQDLNLKFTTAHHDDDAMFYKLRDDTTVQPPFPTPVIVTQEQQVRQRPVRRSSRQANEPQEDKALQTNAQPATELSPITPLVKRGLQGIFYVGVALAILSLIGRMRNSIWDNTSASSSELEQKVNEMELQNNLMRAEIDLLNKQVKYLNTINDPQQQSKKTGKYKGQYEESPYEAKEGKTFKAWSGNGESLRPVEITKADLKRPYKCPDGSFREFAGMCVENRRNEPNIVEQFEQVVEDFKQQSETMQAFEKVAQELHGFTENPFEQVQQILNSDGQQQEPDEKMRRRMQEQPNEFIKNKPIYKVEDPQQQQQFATPSPSKGGEAYQHHHQERSASNQDRKDFVKSKERYEKGEGKFDTKPLNEKDYKRSHEKEYNNKDYKRSFDNQSKESLDKLKYQTKEKKHKHRNGRDANDHDDDDDSKERFTKHQRNDSKERFQKREDNSKENFSKRNHDNDSKERFGKRSKENTSKERFNKAKPTPNDSGEWQEQYMKHREDIRKQNEQKYSGENKNWYIKRGDGREYKRNGDLYNR